jgi:CheY-like chemotaxis protein
MREYVELVLGSAGYSVAVASGGPDALTVVEREGSFDLFVIDVMMPNMRGDELARHLRQRDPDVKVLYFTGYADRLFHENNVLSQHEALLDKSVTVEALREAVSLLLFAHTLGPEQRPDPARRPPTVTKLAPDEQCSRCGGLLFPPYLAPGMVIPETADVICLDCGRAYEWTGNPPRLSVVLPIVPSDEDDDD